jgi:C1A family cysteine protease
MNKQLLGVIPSIRDDRDWTFENILTIKKAEIPSHLLPLKLNYKDIMLPVRDQGAQGTCSAMSASAIKEYQEITEAELHKYHSPQFIYNLRPNDSAGMYPRDTFKILQKIGSVLEEKYPYRTMDEIGEELKNLARKYRIKNYAKVKTIKGVKEALVQNGVVYLAVPVYDYGHRMWKKKSEDDELEGYHAMSIVGYNKESFIVRNSWGKDWNGDGYTLFPYKDWGMHTEAWTIVDMDNIKAKQPPTIFERIFAWIKKHWQILLASILVGGLTLTVIILMITNI